MISTGIIEVDIHGMTANEAKSYIDKILKKVDRSVYRIRVIHGYHGGTSLKSMLTEEYSFERSEKVKKIQGGNNPGITELVLREF